ncbi:MAG TPA: 3-dehydro-L-gulonate 2-dehydrogenase [Verrucomicrobiae bacterium]|jgi:3-dehydro-L-gulonate 2-dehydrogenase|nr:3-dehydro-L-gulonate 2-dehydrogenase [Verrucomicrobiae bacterium]
MIRVPYQEVCDVLWRALSRLGFTPERAALCAQLFADASRDGVYSHGLDRFPRFVRGIRKGLVDIHAGPELVSSHGSLERWDGRSGPGNLNAHHCMARAIALSRQYGTACVALGNTNHWMRGGTYGWQAVDAGVIAICWTNTMPNLPPWGASDPRVGNNPLVVAVPRPKGHVVLDIAMSQFSYGALASYRARGELLPLDGGFDSQGQLTRDPGAIEASARPLPIGYWKGSGLALLLDLMAGLLSGGQFTHQVPADPEEESGLSQVFTAFDLSALTGTEAAAKLADQVIQHLQREGAGEKVRYPGEHVLETRKENMARGIPVQPSIWKEIQEIGL